ncbi:hypothetical protein [Xylophilus sp. GOD-11R]|uniref:hypothetical protein n=1 Tax=Xylophilus sp. GOD-11R TaxID=3089814 RepID=UPI00298D5170|nr:hypothetical protein [Xylophilus sp. GOD-11R]WPB55656.1 hypothetical protein R9X41_16095 [Xylophilus sp. GOD-11R]
MSSIGSISGISPNPYTRSSATRTEGDYETNARLFGPVAASAIGTAEAVGSGASSVVQFSVEALQKAGDAIESGYDAVKSGVTTVGTGVSDLASASADLAESAYDGVAHAVESVADGIGDAANAVTDTVSSALGTVGQYAALGLAASRQFINTVV